MEGLIKIEAYKVHCTIGVHPFELKEEQELLIDIDLTTNFIKCVRSDSIADTVDYEGIGKICRDLAKSRHYNLLETYAYQLLERIMERYSEILKIKIKVRKQNGMPLAGYTAVEIEKERISPI